MDSASAQPAELSAPAELSGLALEQFWREADAVSLNLTQDEFTQVLLGIGARYNHGQTTGTSATRGQIHAFFGALQLQDLALAHACALGRDAAWKRFIERYREFLTQAAIVIAGSTAAGNELADSLYSEMYGVTERGGRRQSPLAYYSGRGSLKGFLRATLAQRNVDRLRRTNRETALPDADVPAPPEAPVPNAGMLLKLRDALTQVLGVLAPEERFLLSALFLDQRTLLQISKILQVHEATVSRRVQRLTSRLRKELLVRLEESGMSRAAAAEALDTDPRDLDMNLRALLQASRPDSFLQQERHSKDS